jgi:hypothetical protein
MGGKVSVSLHPFLSNTAYPRRGPLGRPSSPLVTDIGEVRSVFPTRGDASVPSPPYTTPTPTRMVVRCRLAVIPSIPERWQRCVQGWEYRTVRAVG